MPRRTNPADEALHRFFRRVWRADLAPLLRGERRAARAKAAKVAGASAAAAGLLADSLLGLKGRPFTRALTVLGSSLGAMLPDVWDWNWFHAATPPQRSLVEEQVRRSAAELADAEALRLFGLSPSSTLAELKDAWRRICLISHPDVARNDAERAEFKLRFIAYHAAYERLCGGFESGRLPAPENPPRT